MTTVVALKHLYNRAEYGKVTPGTVLVLRDELARTLLRAGSVALPHIPAYETKVVVPDTKVREASGAADKPFRDGDLPDEGAHPVFGSRDPVLPEAIVPSETAGTVDTGRRPQKRGKRHSGR